MLSTPRGSTGISALAAIMSGWWSWPRSAPTTWKDGDTLFLTCVAWRQLADHVAESLERGMRAIVTGRIKQRSYQTQDGDKRTVYELEADEAGPSLRSATAKVTKISRSGNGKPTAAGETPSGYSDDEPPVLSSSARAPARPSPPGGRSP